MGRRAPRPLAHRSARLLPRSRACRSPPSAWASRRRRAGSEPRRRRARRVLDAGTARRPIRAAPLGHFKREDLSRLGARLPERRARLQLPRDEREKRRRRGAAEVTGDSLDVRCLPAALRRPSASLRPSTSCTMSSRASPNGLAALQSATAASPGAEHWPLGASGAKWTRVERPRSRSSDDRSR